MSISKMGNNEFQKSFNIYEIALKYGVRVILTSPNVFRLKYNIHKELLTKNQ